MLSLAQINQLQRSPRDRDNAVFLGPMRYNVNNFRLCLRIRRSHRLHGAPIEESDRESKQDRNQDARTHADDFGPIGRAARRGGLL